MHEWIDFFLSNQTLALLIPATVFLLTVILVVRRLIGFFITLLFLAFAVGAGVAIANYDVVREYIKENHSNISSLEAQLAEMKRDLRDIFDDLQGDLREQRQSTRKMVTSARDMLDEIDTQSASLRQFVQESVLPTLERHINCGNDSESKEEEE